MVSGGEARGGLGVEMVNGLRLVRKESFSHQNTKVITPKGHRLVSAVGHNADDGERTILPSTILDQMSVRTNTQGQTSDSGVEEVGEDYADDDDGNDNIVVTPPLESSIIELQEELLA